MVLIKKLFSFYSFAQQSAQISEAVEVREKEDYKLSDEVPNSETANREAGETQQRQVTETKGRYAKINRNDTVTIQNG
jgi:preprotein translocase subunit SecA